MATITDEEWEEYKRKYEKTYANGEEDAMRRDLVAKNKKFVDDHNKKYDAGEVSFTCGMNHFSDYTEEENKRMFGGLRRTDENSEVGWKQM